MSAGKNSVTSLTSKFMRECTPVSGHSSASFATRHSHPVATGGSIIGAIHRQSCTSARKVAVTKAFTDIFSSFCTAKKRMASNSHPKRVVVAAGKSTQTSILRTIRFAMFLSKYTRMPNPFLKSPCTNEETYVRVNLKIWTSQSLLNTDQLLSLQSRNSKSRRNTP